MARFRIEAPEDAQKPYAAHRLRYFVDDVDVTERLRSLTIRFHPGEVVTAAIEWYPTPNEIEEMSQYVGEVSNG